MYICIHVCVCVCVCMCTYVYKHRPIHSVAPTTGPATVWWKGGEMSACSRKKRPKKSENRLVHKRYLHEKRPTQRQCGGREGR